MIRSPAGAHRWSLFILILMLAGPTMARAQPLPRVPDTLKTAQSIAPADRATLESAIAAAVAQLQAPTADLQTKARQTIEAEVKVNGQPTASAAYLDLYAQILNDKLKPLMTDPSPRVRLNAAIAASNIAAITNSSHLADVALLAINDKNDAVVLWGLKAARWIIPAQLKAAFGQQPNMALIKVIVPAVKSHPDGTIAGAIADDAYNAVVPAPTIIAQVKPQQHQALAPVVLEILQARLELYKQGIPPTPRAEATATRYLSDPNVWPVLTDAQKQAAMQSFADLIALASEQLKQANSLDQLDLKYVISLTGKAIVAAVAPRLDGPMADALRPVFVINKDTTVSAVTDAVTKVLPTIRGIKGFEKIKDPPRIVDTKPAPPPASAPTSGPIPGAGGAVGNPDAKILAPPVVAPTPAPAPAAPKTPAKTPPAR